jgi:predicted PurR-regulated permease PerM
MMLFTIFLLFFWVWMLVDCLSRKRFEDKLVWVIVLLFLNVVGAVLYYILVKSKD